MASVAKVAALAPFSVSPALGVPIEYANIQTDLDRLACYDKEEVRREIVARALCRYDDNPENIKFEGCLCGLAISIRLTPC